MKIYVRPTSVSRAISVFSFTRRPVIRESAAVILEISALLHFRRLSHCQPLTSSRSAKRVANSRDFHAKWKLHSRETSLFLPPPFSLPPSLSLALDARAIAVLTIDRQVGTSFATMQSVRYHRLLSACVLSPRRKTRLRRIFT